MNTTRPPISLLLALGLVAASLPGQTDWQRFGTFGQVPTGRYAHGFAYDSHRHRTVLFGGYGLGGGYLNDTWEYDGSNWTQMAPPASPSARFAAVMVYDQERRRMVLFGGGNSFGFSDETWEYDGSNWTLRTPTHRPSIRDGNAFAYDTLRRRAVMFGGWDGRRLGDTWEWDGSDWTQVVTVNAPAPRSDVQLAFDARRGVTVLYGGYASGPFDQTWEYDGRDWTLRSPAINPGFLADAALVFDRGRGTVVLFGGAPGQFSQRSGETWEYDGNAWSLLTPSLANSPSARWVAGMVYDEARGRTVLFGGMDNFAQFPNDTWELVTTPQVATYRMSGRGCAGTTGTPALTLSANDLPRLGGVFGVRLHNLPAGGVPFVWLGASKTNWGALALPFDLTAAGMPQCRILVSLDFGFAVANLGGTAQAAFAVPNQPALLGATLHVQGTVHDTGANAAGFTWSDAGEARLGH